MTAGGATHLLRDVVRATAACTDPHEALARLAGLLVGRLAEWVVADRLDDPDLVVRVAALGPSGPLGLPAGADARRSSAQAGGLLAAVLDSPSRTLRLGEPELRRLATQGDPRVREQVAQLTALQARDVVLLGLGGRQPAGVLVLGRSDRAFTRDELVLAADVALHVGLVLDAARLLQAQRNVSAALQKSLLPPLPPVEGLALSARYHPAVQGLEVGGDWYDAFLLPDGALALVVGDATGHDLAAAASMAALRSGLRALAVDRQEQPAQVLGRLDRVGDALRAAASGTCLYARLESPVPGAGTAWRLRWSSAGHLPPLLLRDGRAQLLETPADLMLGVDPAAVRTDHERALHPGDLLLLYTDGLVEERRHSLDAQLAGLCRLVEGAVGADPEALAELLLGALPGDDDAAVLVVRVLA